MGKDQHKPKQSPDPKGSDAHRAPPTPKAAEPNLASIAVDLARKPGNPDEPDVRVSGSKR